MKQVVIPMERARRWRRENIGMKILFGSLLALPSLAWDSGFFQSEFWHPLSVAGTAILIGVANRTFRRRQMVLRDGSLRIFDVTRDHLRQLGTTIIVPRSAIHQVELIGSPVGLVTARASAPYDPNDTLANWIRHEASGAQRRTELAQPIMLPAPNLRIELSDPSAPYLRNRIWRRRPWWMKKPPGLSRRRQPAPVAGAERIRDGKTRVVLRPVPPAEILVDVADPAGAYAQLTSWLAGRHG
jgi:hypothetical protein